MSLSPTVAENVLSISIYLKAFYTFKFHPVLKKKKKKKKATKEL